MVDWVENGNPPETVTGTKYINVSSSIPDFQGKECDANKGRMIRHRG
jgi:hypothetical protein